MAGYEGCGSPTPSEHEHNDDKNEDNITEHEEEAQEDNDTQADETMNDGEPNESSPQDNNDMNPGNEADSAQGLPESEDAEMAQPAHVGSDSDIMAHDPDADLDLEELLGGMIVAVLDYDNGQMELLVMSIDSTPATPEL
ncbi:Hypothetical predicted protein [Paramuricea clavata]|uniref:Uncharacterized protein n=1 Tax=Paramuricea clavata TaxID=317549 RepID=A0A6S7G6D8_PARCT|nr:Hypothetical predicted protein [Paramuricea clavata]